MIDRYFRAHPRDIGMSYAAHGAGAAKIGLTMIGGGLLCLVHAAVPGLFQRTTTNILESLTETTHRRRDINSSEERA